ncbi:BMP family ABC transporter substrate-binding protein [Evansella cellulosilytica]|uniref:Basic membrane lipoprotein n=1 Tax=Evansella cellulosilytica (strain ATCC 21833 / DSM 2522 / FERM P-1141 / JCM 9156 / N-4) TaxID=649639 RepID=E6TXW3_EVAC2|nr:BMP family ABC transporter substrate-binding protein [Evansella cellulosilytica]ADU31176.1 basic membrane lipoprotein [Evansella cellulosilytica DSM 2522]
MKGYIYLLIVLSILLFTGCSQSDETHVEFKKIGLLLSDPIDDHGWNSKAYQGVLNIQSTFDVQVYIKEDIQTSEQIYESIEEFSNEGVTLLFGHSYLYADYFMDLKDEYPHIHFVSFNGDVSGDGITSIHFEGYSMGYFAGMLASEMSHSNKVGIIAAFPFQPEVEGFIEGANYQNENIKVFTEFVYDWTNEEKALEHFYNMKGLEVDIFYPAGDGFHVTLVNEIKDSGLYAIGYVGDHIDLGESTILTSTVQDVERLYEHVANEYQNGTLENGNIYYDFEEGVISLGTFSTEVPDEIREKIEVAIAHYIETGQLPHEMNE